MQILETVRKIDPLSSRERIPVGKARLAIAYLEYCQFWLTRINLQQCPAVEHASLLKAAKNVGTILFVHPPYKLPFFVEGAPVQQSSRLLWLLCKTCYEIPFRSEASSVILNSIKVCSKSTKNCTSVVSRKNEGVSYMLVVAGHVDRSSNQSWSK